MKAQQWLISIGRADVAEHYDNFVFACKGTKTRRSLWDLLAGERSGTTALGIYYKFPIFIEACERKGIEPPEGAILGGKPAPPRKPQVKKWGKRLRDVRKS
jgi:hypothetical protein